MDEVNEKLEQMLISLTDIQQSLQYVMDATGVSNKVIEMENEIRMYGWSYIVAKYHPDSNVDDPASMPLFEMYKLIHDRMQTE